MRRVGEGEVAKEVEGWARLDEKGMKRETKRLVSKLNKMLRKRPWQSDKGTVSNDHLPILTPGLCFLK